MISFVVTGLLLILGVLLAKQGLSYIFTPRNPVLLSLLKKEGLSGPGLDIIVPFLGISYLTIGSLNLLAAAFFTKREASSILLVSGLIFHIGMATVRACLEPGTYNLYKQGAIWKTNIVQLVVGVACVATGIIGLVYDE